MSGEHVYRLPEPPAPRSQWSLPHMLRLRAESHHGHAFLRWTSAEPALSFGEAHHEVATLAARLSDAGVGPGDRVMLLMNNSIGHVISWLAVNWLGAVDFPVNPAFTAPYLAEQMDVIRPSRVICDQTLHPLLTEALTRTSIAVPRIFVREDLDGSLRGALGSIRGLDALATSTAPLAALDQDVASIMSTSGTTGPSKGVRMTHAQTYFYSFQTVHLHRMSEEDTYLAPYPLFHASARIHGVGSALVSGGECVLYDRFSASRFAERVVDSGATITHFLGSMMTLVLDAGIPEDRGRLRSVMALPTPAGLVSEFRERFGVENVTEVIGMTELSWPIMTPYGADRPAGAAGLAVADWYDVETFDPATDEPVGLGEVGELVVRPKHSGIVSTGYENMDHATVDAWKNLWFHSGDLVRRDADGWFHYVDRLKDSIRRRGENVSSHEVEEVLRRATGVADAAVVGRRLTPDGTDEEVVAFVVPHIGTTLRGEDLESYARPWLPPYAVPTEFHIVSELPLTPSGKVRKTVLRELAETSHD